MSRNIASFNRKVSALMVRHGLISQEELTGVVENASQQGKTLFDLLIEEDYLDEMTLLGLISEDCGLTPIDLDKVTIDVDYLEDVNGGTAPVSKDDAFRLSIMPVALIGKYLTVAVSNPYDVIGMDDIKLHLGKTIMPVVSSHRAISNAIEKSYDVKQKQLEAFMEGMETVDDDDLVVSEAQEAEGAEDLMDTAGEGSPAVKLANMIIVQAIQEGASDIHIEPFERRLRVRLRIDGVLHEQPDPPKKLERGLASRLKIMTDTMNIAERGKPQDGRFQIKIAGRAVDFRVNSLPTVHGEKICMRILDKGNLAGSLESLCFEPAVLDIIKRSIGSPYGMFLVTGPTGSGKSTTLYSCLQAVMGPEDNVNTVEDPVEYEIEG